MNIIVEEACLKDIEHLDYIPLLGNMERLQAKTDRTDFVVGDEVWQKKIYEASNVKMKSWKLTFLALSQ